MPYLNLRPYKSLMKEKHLDKHSFQIFTGGKPLMTTNGKWQLQLEQRNIPGPGSCRTPYQTIQKRRGCIGRTRTALHSARTSHRGYENFNFDMKHLKLLERTVGNIWIQVSHARTNPSPYKNKEGQSRLYGALLGSAGLNMSGQGNPTERHSLHRSFPITKITPCRRMIPAMALLRW